MVYLLSAARCFVTLHPIAPFCSKHSWSCLMPLCNTELNSIPTLSLTDPNNHQRPIPQSPFFIKTRLQRSNTKMLSPITFAYAAALALLCSPTLAFEYVHEVSSRQAADTHIPSSLQSRRRLTI